MYQPETYVAALMCMLGSMLCWGSWANTLKMTPGYRFQLFYWDYCIGLLLLSLVGGLTLGSFGSTPTSFLTSLASADSIHLAYAITAGIIFNAANLLLVAAIAIAGMAVAFPVGIGLALVIGVLLNYILAPQGNAWLLLAGVLLVTGAIAVDALAYRRREGGATGTSSRGLRLALLSGVLMGSFYPLVTKALSGNHNLGPYSVNFVFSIGVFLCSLVMNTFLMRKPLDGALPVQMTGYRTASFRDHLWGVLGGSIWSSGAMLSFAASGAHLVGPAISYAVGQGATMVSAVWGVFIWKEFADAPPKAKRLLPLMFALFLAGLSLLACAPLLAAR